ncbi:MAG: PA0069 family radical SAM protein [Pseudomonadota bacterium]
MNKLQETMSPHVRRPGRAARSNTVGRFERFDRNVEHDGWDIPEDDRILRTSTRMEQPRRIITYNRSPDLPFDRSINPYRGCEHGCIYCFARPTHAWLGMSAGLDFETKLIARPDAPRILRQELRQWHYRVAPIAIGTNTDPYQPIEHKHEIMRACLEELSACDHPVAIVTKGSLIERDIDVLAPMADKGLLRVGISVTTLDATLARRMEPRAPRPERRLQTIARLTDAGIPVRIMASPIVPGLSCHEVEALLKAGAEAGAVGASWAMLRLPLEVSPLFREWLQEHYPHRVNRVMNLVREMHDGRDYSSEWGRRMRGSGAYAEIIAQRFDNAARRNGLSKTLHNLRCDLFKRPQAAGDQLSLALCHPVCETLGNFAFHIEN